MNLHTIRTLDGVGGRDKERRYEQELRERAAKEAPDATAD